MTRMRSPNYPGIPLGQAIDLTEKIFKADRTNVIDKDVAAEHMGYSGLTGRTLKLLGALSQFGLLDKVGKGKVRVSKTAVTILHGFVESEKQEAMATAASSPPLFRRIRDSFENPSDKTITSFLMQEGFTDAAVSPVLKSYKETNTFLAANGVSESYGSSPLDEQESLQDDLEDEDDDMEQHDTGERKTGQGRVEKPLERAVEQQSGPLKINFDMTELRVSGMTSDPDELQDFIEDLETLKAILEKRRKAQAN